MECDTITRILEILEMVLEDIRHSNPYGLVLKGGTALAIHHIKGHRESEDLDFDVGREHFDKAEEVSSFIVRILDDLVKKKVLKSYDLRKKGFASTDRYHMNLTLMIYKPFNTKIDLDFVDLPDNLEYEGELGFYTVERMFIAKLLTFSSRKEMKDLFDIHHLLGKVDPGSFENPQKLASLIDRVIEISSDESLMASYKKAYRGIDLRFKNMTESNIVPLFERTRRNLRMFRNDLLKQER